MFQAQGKRYVFHDKASFYAEEMLAPCPNPKLEDHRLSPVHDCLFNLFAATFHIRGHSSIRNLRAHHAMLTETCLSWAAPYKHLKLVLMCMDLGVTWLILHSLLKNIPVLVSNNFPLVFL